MTGLKNIQLHELKIKLHRLDGPAIESVDGYKEWYVDDKQLTEQEFNEKLKSTNTLQRAFQCRQDLFKVLTLFKETHMQAVVSADVSDEAIDQLDTTACELARLYDSLPDVFVAHVRD